MARAGQVPAPKGEITELTNADVTDAITFQNIASNDARLIGTTDDTEPSEADFADGLVLRQLDGPPFGSTLDDIFPGASYKRLWALSKGGCTFTVYHA